MGVHDFTVTDMVQEKVRVRLYWSQALKDPFGLSNRFYVISFLYGYGNILIIVYYLDWLDHFSVEL